ncbi:putative enoyl-CoA hydratase [bacterium BMS3Abin02]|nr:putative enoyl-CoA hydratase [bacterium BMS3Abin02]GBE22439.1 putative enoyl-CoA hydratase [bacterium BMS3Bbin01]HDK45908.1 enoyl-CoA hydratase/isomerase family protein [Actinomycetota bacterium]HDL49253.1 enoyl-CoA hydratase/isomerase family protein [Actinomycetota bacterium]
MQFVEYTTDGPVALIRLNRPPVNALSMALAAELSEAFAAAAVPSIRAVVITGEPHFAAGADIKEFQAAFEAGEEDRLASDLGGAVLTLERLAKPTIAAVRGFALGGGLELAMGADFRYLSTDARVGQPEILLGIIPGAGGTQRLARLIGQHKAKELIFSGRHVPADEALDLGIADRVVDDVLEAALEDAHTWANGPTVAYGAAKRALDEGLRLPLEEGLAVEREGFVEAFRSADAREGVQAFLAKRPATFTGE